MAHVDKPAYIDPAGDPRQGSLPVRPPFQFSGVTARVFPLKANMARLVQFVNAYVNMDIPPELVQFRPALPYVYLMVLDYGSMSSASMHAQNVGWVSQHEVAFTVPLQRWCREGVDWVFKDWACVSPFIFVDDEMSLTTGREVYGWPKIAGRVDAVAPMWDHHPMSASRLFTFSTSVFPRVYAGEAETERVLLSIDADPAPSYSAFPPDPGNRWSPWAVVAQAAESSLSLMGQAADMLLALRSRGYRTDRSLGSLRAMGGRAAGYALEMGPSLLRGPLGALLGAAGGTQPRGEGAAPKLAFDNITVKQFRDAQEPDRACYKALIRSVMGVERINRSGLLGDTHLLRGDSSGGYTIRVHRYVSQPIIQSLGIEVAATEGHGEGTTVSVLKPVFPFWNDVDLYYGAGEAICSRIYLKGVEGLEAWLDERPDAPANAEPAVATDKAPPSTAAMFGGYGEVPRLRSSGDYNTALGAATQPVAGPFNFPDVTQQIYPLLAERAQLDGFVERYLNEPLRAAGLRFETLGSYAYLMVNCIGDQIGTMWSGTNDIGWWAEREVSFCVPVKWYATNERGEEELLSVALVAPFFYASNGRAVITDREVNGRPTVKAVIESPADVWLESSGPNQPRKYLELTTEVFPALGYGQKAESRTLIEIDAADVLAYNDDVGWRQVGERWGRDLVGELMRKQVLHTERAAEIAAARAMALEILAHDAPINWLVLKQYRDAADVGQTCYQALVQTRRSIERIYDIREIEDRVHVRVHRYPGHPIVDTLGLKLKSLQSGGGQVVQNLQPLRPFWMRLSVREELATVVAVRRPDGQWHRAHTWLQHADAAADSGAEDADPGVPYLRALGRTRVHPAWPVPPQRLRERQGQALRSALRSSLQGVIEALSALPSAECDALIGRLPAGARAQIDALGSSADAAAFADGCELGDLLALERALGMAGLVWQASDVRLERLTHAQARDAIEGVGDVQVVLESILGAEWENWGNPRFFRKLPPLPEPRIPNASLQGGFDALRSCAPTVPASLGLRQTDDKAWCYVDPPKAQPSAPGPAQ